MIYILVALAAVHCLWVHYVAVMKLKDVREAKKLTTAAKVFGYPALFVGLILDFFVNLILGTILFLELPREWTLSGRLYRLSTLHTGWRQYVAERIRKALLDDIDSAGIHRG